MLRIVVGGLGGSNDGKHQGNDDVHHDRRRTFPCTVQKLPRTAANP